MNHTPWSQHDEIQNIPLIPGEENGSGHVISYQVISRMEGALIRATEREAVILLTGGRLNKKDGLTRYGDSHVKDKTS